MVKKIVSIGIVIAVLAVTFSQVGVAYAQTQNPPKPANPSGLGVNGGNNGMMGGPGRRGGMMGGMRGGSSQTGVFGPYHEYMMAAIADVFEISIEEIQAAFDAGKTIWDLAQEKGLTQEQFIEKMQQARALALEKAVADGVITQPQADWKLNRMGQMLQNGAGGGPCMGGAGGGRWGRSGGGWNAQPATP